jgi:hypothetical protein
MQHFLLRPVSVQQHAARFLRRSTSSLSLSPHVRAPKLRNITILQRKRTHTSQLPSPLGLQPRSTPAGPDSFNYTSGHWLRRDALERKARRIHLNFDALCSKVISLCPGAQSIKSYSKIEGGYNRVFIFHTNNAQRIVARLPFLVTGPARLRTSSKVATIKYRMSLSTNSERVGD